MRSMTGFGAATAARGGVRIAVQISVVNGRRLDLRVGLSRDVAFVEKDIRDRVQAALTRGSANVNVDCQVDESVGREATIDRNLARALVRELRQVREELGLVGEVAISDLLAVPEVVQVKAPELPPAELAALVLATVEQALAQVLVCRQTEGAALAAELSARLATLGQLHARISARAPLLPGLYRERLQQRIRELAAEVAADDERLVREVAIFCDRADVSEELARLASHLAQLSGLLTQPDEQPVGRQLDFFLQEVGREINTIGSKANDAAITQCVVEFKSEAERLREQAQNVE